MGHGPDPLDPNGSPYIRLSVREWMVRVDAKLDLVSSAIMEKANRSELHALESRLENIESGRNPSPYAQQLLGQFNEMVNTTKQNRQDLNNLQAVGRYKRGLFSGGWGTAVLLVGMFALALASLIVSILIRLPVHH